MAMNHDTAGSGTITVAMSSMPKPSYSRLPAAGTQVIDRIVSPASVTRNPKNPSTLDGLLTTNVPVLVVTCSSLTGRTKGTFRPR
ncbi:MAG: hypothetical protein CMJ18_14420 [Phycisphaeraceae bacterium]|nr:hypothetical protein [Phycisphaeraceae bacterium]